MNLLKFIFIIMAKKSVIQREKKRETLVKKYQVLRSSLKKSISGEESFEKKLGFYYRLQKLPRNSCLSRLV